MKFFNKFRFRSLIRNYLITFSITTLSLVFGIVLIQENSDLLSRVVSPEYVNLNIVETSFNVLDICVPTFIVLFLFHLWKVYSREYLLVWNDFVEGPSENGERELLSFSQIEYIGRDIFGRFNLKGSGKSIVLPGNLTNLDVLELEKELKIARSNNDL